jgi:hypothetical protein
MISDSTLQTAKKILFTFFLIFIVQLSSAQNSKTHFIIHNPGNSSENAKIENAFSTFDFDSFRFYDKRRTIKFTGSDISIELYSAKELLDTYGKPVSPFTIMNNKPSKEIEFYYFPAEGKVKINEMK